MFNKNEFITYLKNKYEKSQFTSYREFGKAADVDHGYISKMLSGKKDTPPSPEILMRLSKALNVDYYKMMILSGYLEKDLFSQGSFSNFLSLLNLSKQFKKILLEINFDYLKITDKAIKKGITPQELEYLIENYDKKSKSINKKP